MRRILCVAGLLFVSVSLYSLGLFPPQIRLYQDTLSADFRIKGRLPLRVIGAIDDGIRINIIFEYRLKRKKQFFLSSDPVIKAGKASYAVTQNLLDGTYVVKSSGGEVFAFRTRRQYFKKLTAGLRATIIRFSRLKVGVSYYLEVRLLIRSTKMYPPFSFLSVFSSESSWVKSGVIVP